MRKICLVSISLFSCAKNKDYLVGIISSLCTKCPKVKKTSQYRCPHTCLKLLSTCSNTQICPHTKIPLYLTMKWHDMWIKWNYIPNKMKTHSLNIVLLKYQTVGNFIRTKTQAATLVTLKEAGSQRGRSSRGQGHAWPVGCVQALMYINSRQRGETWQQGIF